MVVAAPPIGTVCFFNNLFREEPFECAEQDNVVFAMEVYPAAVAVSAVVTLKTPGCRAVPDVVECMAVDIAEDAVEILT